MVRTYRNPQGGSLGGVFDGGGVVESKSRHQQQVAATAAAGVHYDQEIKSGGFSSSSEEFSSPLPAHHPHHHHQAPTNHHPNNTQFSPTNPYFQNGGQQSRRNYTISPTTAAQLASESGGRIRADPMGNIFIVPRQMDVGVCTSCRNVYGGNGGSHDHYHQHHAHGHIDYDDLLNQKRRAEVQYRNGGGADSYVSPGGFGGMKGSSSEQFLTRVAEPSHEDFGLANGLNDLSNVLSRLQQHNDLDDSTQLTSLSYPNSANNPGGSQATTQNRQSWSAPQGMQEKPPIEVNGRAKMQAERNRIRQIAMGGSLTDPMERLRGTNSQASQYNNKSNGYNPSMYDQGNKHRGEVTNGKDPYLRELEQQISETRERRKRETTEYQDWWEKRQEPPFVVKMPTRPHPSQTADQRPDPRLGQKNLQDELRLQMELKKRREAEEKAREREEEAKLEKRIQEQQERMRKEFEEEQAKKKAKEQAKLKRQEDMARRQQEIQKEAERQKKEAAERKFQERKASRIRRQEEERMAQDSSRGSTPTPLPKNHRLDSPPIPALRNSQGGNTSNSEFESGSMGLSSNSEDDQESVAALTQLSKMRKQLDKKQEDLGLTDEETNKPEVNTGGGGAGGGKRRNSIWDGLAEI